MEVWVWLAVIVLSVIIELTTDQLLSIWFVPGALIAIIMDCFNAEVLYQVIVFLIVSIIGLFLLRRFLVKYTGKHIAKTNIDAIIGEKCVVTERIHNFAGCGQVKVHGQIWSARGCSDDDVFEEGEVLHVVAIEGVKLICKKQ